ncbi:TPR-like protein [Gonapodya prolifera JEL478]|uniref:TPR-like protein n=1 Tax=Gonapodya prolifera (strain JEL478) TaxID=1344416 RepID=A0A139AFZ6_GONPJ|nr:TPR-like protein [Gonapodya prolifera JEL478]|eukprot:KXS15484.1 TPR-like protein [Gonapodya prolifera JEL478]
MASPSNETQPPIAPETSSHGSVTVTVKVISGRNIRGSKGDKPSTSVRVQFGDLEAKDSAVVADSSNPEYAHSWNQAFDIDERTGEAIKVSSSRGTSAHGPETKATSKTTQTTPSTLFRETVNILTTNAPPETKKLAPPGSVAAGSGDDTNRPTLEVEVSLSRPLLSEDDHATGMFVAIHPMGLSPTPEEWTVKEPNEKDPTSNIYQYTLHVTLPTSKGRDQIVKIPHGILVAPDQETASKVDGTHGALSRSPSTLDATSAVLGSTAVSFHKKQVLWTNPTVVWMYKEGLDRLKEKVMAKEPLEIELTRELQPRFAHVTEGTSSRFRARSTLDCSTLILPRVTTVCARCSLDAWVDPEAKTAKKGDKGEDPFAKVGAAVRVEVVLERELIERKKLQPLTHSVRDYIPVRKNLTADTYAKRAKRAEADFQAKIQEVARRLVKEWSEIVGQEALKKVKEGLLDDADKAKKKFLYHLNSSGVYFQLKESLKPAVTSLVREHFRQTTPLPNSSELQLFLSRLYVHLCGSMHTALHSLFRDPARRAEDAIVEERKEYAALGRFAEECEKDGDSLGGEKYHLERVAKWEGSEEAWYEYGCFEMRRGNGETGVECFKEVLAGLPGARGGSDTGKHIPSLLAYGATCTTLSKFDEARVMLETAHQLGPTYHLACTLLGLHFEIVEMDEESEKWIGMGRKFWEEEKRNREKETNPEQKSGNDDQGPKSRSLMLDAAEFLMHCKATQMAERAIAVELLRPTVPVNLIFRFQSRLAKLRGQHEEAVAYLTKALEKRQDDPDVWAEWGHQLFELGKWEDAREKYEVAGGMEGADVEDPYLLNLRLSTILLHFSHPHPPPLPIPGTCPVTLPLSTNRSLASHALHLALTSLRHRPTSRAWLAVARACLALGRWDDAELALGEANAGDPRDGRVWVWLAVVSVEKGRMWEGKQAWEQVRERGGRGESEALRLLAGAFLRSEEPGLAADVLRLAIEQGWDRGCGVTQTEWEEEVRGMFERAVEEADAIDGGH